jgi:hypothetical protein
VKFDNETKPTVDEVLFYLKSILSPGVPPVKIWDNYHSYKARKTFQKAVNMVRAAQAFAEGARPKFDPAEVDDYIKKAVAYIERRRAEGLNQIGINKEKDAMLRDFKFQMRTHAGKGLIAPVDVDPMIEKATKAIRGAARHTTRRRHARATTSRNKR